MVSKDTNQGLGAQFVLDGVTFPLKNQVCSWGEGRSGSGITPGGPGVSSKSAFYSFPGKGGFGPSDPCLNHLLLKLLKSVVCGATVEE